MVVYNYLSRRRKNFQTFHPDCHIFAVKTKKKDEDYFSITFFKPDSSRRQFSSLEFSAAAE